MPFDVPGMVGTCGKAARGGAAVYPLARNARHFK
jgi:hypothetical protein